MKTKSEILKQARTFATAKFNQLRPAMTATLVACGKELQALTAASGTTEAMGEPLSKAFTEGLEQVITSLMSFRSGYASNDPSQQIDPKAIPGFADTNAIKSEKSDAPRATLKEFVDYATGIIKGADALPVHEALDSLAGLIKLIDKASEETVAGVVLPTSTDPAKQISTVASGSMIQPPAGDDPSKTPDAAGAGAASSTSGIAAVAASTGAGDEPTKTPEPAGAGAGTSAVAAAAASSGNGDEPGVSKAAAPVAPVVEEAVEWADDLAKSLSQSPKGTRDAGWGVGGDLNSREFLTGVRSHDFGRDGTK